MKSLVNHCSYHWQVTDTAKNVKKLAHLALWEEVQNLSFLCRATSLYSVLQLILRYILKLVLAVSQGMLCQKTSARKMSSM